MRRNLLSGWSGYNGAALRPALGLVLAAIFIFGALVPLVYGEGGREVMVDVRGQPMREYMNNGPGPLQGLYPIRGKVTSCTNTTTASSSITVNEWNGKLNEDLLTNTNFTSTSGGSDTATWFLARVVQVDDIADQELTGRWCGVMSLTAAGVLVTKPAITDDAGTVTLDADDYIEIIPWTWVNTPGVLYHGFCSGAGDVDSAVFVDLIGKEEAITLNSTIKCLDDASATTNDGSVAKITYFDPRTGTVAFTPSFAAAPAVLDEFLIQYEGTGEVSPSSGLESSYYIEVNTGSFAAEGNFEEIGFNRILTVTGLIRVRIIAEIVTGVDMTGNTQVASLGTVNSSQSIISNTIEDFMDTGQIWVQGVQSVVSSDFSGSCRDEVVYGENIGHTLQAAATAGRIIYHCWITPLALGAGAVAGAGEGS